MYRACCNGRVRDGPSADAQRGQVRAHFAGLFECLSVSSAQWVRTWLMLNSCMPDTVLNFAFKTLLQVRVFYFIFLICDFFYFAFFSSIFPIFQRMRKKWMSLRVLYFSRSIFLGMHLRLLFFFSRCVAILIRIATMFFNTCIFIFEHFANCREIICIYCGLFSSFSISFYINMGNLLWNYFKMAVLKFGLLLHFVLKCTFSTEFGSFKDLSHCITGILLTIT